MGSPERIRSSKRDTEENSDLRSPKDEEEYEGDDKRKHRSSKSRKSNNGEEAEALESSGRKRSSGDRNESRKRSGGSSKDGSDEDDDYEARKESRLKQMKKKQEESALEKLSNWYQDGEGDNRHDGGDKSRGHGRGHESERRKSSLKKIAEGKDEGSHDEEIEKALDRESKSDRRENSREKGHGSRRRWDESDLTRKAEESSYVEEPETRTGKSNDHKHENDRERSLSAKPEPSESKIRGSDSNSEKEESKSKTRLEDPEEDNRESPKERPEEHRQQRTPTRIESRAEEDVSTWMRDKGRREVDRSNRPSSPERSGRRHHDSDYFETDIERRRKEPEKEVYRDDRPKARDDSWSDRNRDREGSKDNWKRRQSNEKETKDSDMAYEHGRDWDPQRRGRDRSDHERLQGRAGGRKDGIRTEAVKTSSNYGISNENYDVIEIQTKPFDYGREDSRSGFVRSVEAGQQSDTKLAPNDEDYVYPRESRGRNFEEDTKDRFMDEGPTLRDQNLWRDEIDFQTGKGRAGQKGNMPNRPGGAQSSSSSSHPPHGNQEVGPFNRNVPQGFRGSRVGRGGNRGGGRPTGRDNQQVGMPLPMLGSPFGPLGMPPPGAMQPLTPAMSPAPGPPISPGVFIPPFSPPVWPGARGVEMNMLAVPPGLSPVPPGPTGPRFPTNVGTPPSPAMYFNQQGPTRGPPNISNPSFNPIVPVGRGQPQEKPSGGWAPPRNSGPPGKAPSRGEQNDYSQNFVDTGMRPQNFIRELELTSVVEDYPKLRELIQKKDEIVAKSASPPMYYKCDLREQVLSPELFGTKFDVILVDPPWEEYVHRAPGVTDHMDYWTFEEIMNLKIEAIADTPSFIFLWVGDGLGLEQGRQCLKKWGFRRCEDICWVKTNKTNATPGLRHDSHTLFQRSKEHCLMGIKGTVRRSTDGHIIHANIDTDVIIAEEPPYGSTAKPEDMYRIVEHFSLGRRRLELFGEDHNIRSGWLTVGKDLSSSNFNAEAYIRNFADKEGKVWQGGGGRNPPPEAGHLVVTTPDIEALRPKSPMKNQQQLQQQQSASISLTTGTSNNRRPTANSPQNHNAPGLNQEASSSNILGSVPWAPPMEGFKGGNMGSDFDVYGYNGPFGQGSGDYTDFESHRGGMNLL